MTIDPGTRNEPDDLFVADFYPLLGEYLADQHAAGYDAAAGRARFSGWLNSPAAGPVADYVAQLGTVPPLDAGQETELARRIEAARDARRQLAGAGVLSAKARRELKRIAADGARATNLLLEANLALVASVAERFTGRGVPFLDLVQEGNLGLIRAAEKFDRTKGYRFATYATWWIRQAMTRALASQVRTIRIAVPLVELVNKLGRAQHRLRHDLGREPTAQELASELDVAPAQVMEAQQYLRELGAED